MVTTGHVDDELERSVRRSLATGAGLDERDCAVVAMNRRVRLCGETRSYAEKRRAADLAASVPGVRVVINQLRVTPG